MVLKEFKTKAKKGEIKNIELNKCSICEFMMEINVTGDMPTIDTGCDCVNYSRIQEITWEEAYSIFIRKKDN